MPIVIVMANRNTFGQVNILTFTIISTNDCQAYDTIDNFLVSR